MTHTRIIFACLTAGIIFAGTASAQGAMGTEPSPRVLGTPPYPGAVFIRTITGLDPYHATAEYVTPDPGRKVLAFFERKLPDKRRARYADRETRATIILMNPWSKIPGVLTRDTRDLLETEPNIQISAFSPARYGALLEYFRMHPGNQEKIDALLTGETMLRYTYRIPEQNVSAKRAVGVWRATDRDLPAFTGGVLELRRDGGYTLRLPGGRTENGRYLIRDDLISMQTARPVCGPARKNGAITVGRASLSLQLTGLPRLTFVRMRDDRPEPPPAEYRHEPPREEPWR